MEILEEVFRDEDDSEINVMLKNKKAGYRRVSFSEKPTKLPN